MSPELVTTMSVIFGCVGVVGTAFTVYSNAVMAKANARTVALTKTMVDEMINAREPSIYLDLEFGEWGIVIVIGNAGQSTAKNIKFNVGGNPPGSFSSKENSLATLNVFKNGISFLNPNSAMRYPAGVIYWDQLSSENAVITVDIDFDSESGRALHRPYQFDLSQYEGLQRNSTYGPYAGVEKALSKIADQLQTANMSDKMFPIHDPHTKRCPMCAEFIMANAKKCPRCLEMIEQKEKKTTT